MPEDDTHPLKRLLQHAGHHRKKVIAAVSASILNKLFDLAPPALIGAAVDVVVKQEDSLLAHWGVVEISHQLALLGVLTVVIWGCESLFEYLYAWLWRTLAQTLQHELRLEAYGHIQDLDMHWFADQSRGALMSVLNDDINQLERFLNGGANSILQVLTTVLVVGATFFLAEPRVAVWAILPVPLVLWGSFRFQSRIAPLYVTVREEVARLNAILSNNLGGIETIKSFSSEAREVERVREASDRYQVANGKAIRLSAAFVPLIRMVIVIGFTATLLYGGQLAIDGQMEVGTYSVLVFLTQRLLWPLTRLGETFDLYQRAIASTTRVLDLLETKAEIVDGNEAQATVTGAINFDSVDFAYPGRDPLLSQFNLHIEAGKTVAIVGPTGSGKSSLIRLLLRLYDPQGGCLRLDGQDITSKSLNDLRNSIALVSQHTYLFPGTVAENVAYGRPDASEEEIWEALKLAEAATFVEALPQGIHTTVGETGQRLSGGQRQRLSIARAVLPNAPILVLDEATSAVDNETEAAIQRAMAQIAKGRTTLIIAHRLSTIRYADEIIVLDGGEVIERGNHNALVALGGSYAQLWRIQTGEAGTGVGKAL